jgi:hypothetical protein
MVGMSPATVAGQTYLVFIRFKTSVDMSVQFGIQGAFTEFDKFPIFTAKAGRWHDYVLKTASDVTYPSANASGTQALIIHATNSSGSTGVLTVDRVDFKVVAGDVFLP